MSTKQQVICILEEHRGSWVSGERIATELGVSRASVWKAVKALRDAGYDIEGASNKGYLLSDAGDPLSQVGIQHRLLPSYQMRVEVHEEVSSTITFVRERAEAGEPEGLVVVAGTQTAGRGRFGRPFFSPRDSGIYLSLLLRPRLTPKESGYLTSVAAVAVAEAIEKRVGKQALIKWVNDVYVDGRKVCGILTEASFGMETGMLDYAVPGIGINVYQPEGGFPTDIAARAGVLVEERGSGLRNQLAAEVVNRFMSYYLHLSERTFLEPYRARSFVPGHDIEFTDGKIRASAYALEVDDDLRLRVRLGDGSEMYLQSGEVSIKVDPR